jgi:2-isopropylmalate synthase
VALRSHEPSPTGRALQSPQATIDGKPVRLTGEGNGPIAAFVHAVRDGLGVDLDVVDYHEHSLGRGADATAVAYVETVTADSTTRWGIGTDPNIITASFCAVLSATNRVLDEDAVA